jgi:hypothetical protein
MNKCLTRRATSTPSGRVAQPLLAVWVLRSLEMQRCERVAKTTQPRVAVLLKADQQPALIFRSSYDPTSA